MPWPLKTFPACQKTQSEKTTIGGGKRYHVKVIWYSDVWQSSNISLISWLSEELLPELLQLLRTIVHMLKRLPCILWLCAACPPTSILQNSFDSSWVDNLLDFPNLFLVLTHVLRLVSPSEWIEKCSMDYVVPLCILRNLKSISVRTNCFDDFTRS